VPDVDKNGAAFCSWSPYYRWRNIIPGASIVPVVESGTSAVTSMAVVDQWPDGRVKTLRAAFADGSSATLDGHKFYSRAGAALGYKVLPSALFTVAGAPSSAFEFDGRGLGHGVGMCQWGAEGRARSGLSAEEILAAYFPGTEISKL